MRSFLTSAAVAAATASTVVNANLNILMTNDDGWGSANIRASKAALEAQGHKVLIIGPLDNQSGVGGAVNLPTSNVSETGGLYGLATPGASYYASDPMDDSLRYFNGTPAACSLWGLNNISGGPQFFEDGKIDLVVTGPNEGTNLGSFVGSLSGTWGAAFAAALYGTPAIAFSAKNSTHRPYTDIDPNNPYDPATLAGGLVADFVSAMADGFDKSAGGTVLPVGVGINVNFPYLNSSCSAPEFGITRLTGGAYIDGFEFTDEGFPTWTNIERPGVNRCIHGDCDLPGETDFVLECQSSISVFSVDYDAPTYLAKGVQDHIKTYLAPLVNTRMKKRSMSIDGRRDVRRKAF